MSFTNTFKKIIGVILVIAGVVLHLIPLFPASWIIVLGLEMLGLRILLQNKCQSFLSKLKHNKNSP